MLTEWSKKWENKISKGPEFQEYSIYTAWEGLITEANATAALHSQSDSKLDDLCGPFSFYLLFARSVAPVRGPFVAWP